MPGNGLKHSTDRSSILRCTLSGSFNKHFDELQRVRRLITSQRISVLAPKGTEIAETRNEFVLLKGDKGGVRSLELSHLKAIQRSDFLFVVNPDRSVGPSVSLEIGFAIASGIPVFSLHRLTDPVFAAFVTMVPIRRLRKEVLTRRSARLSNFAFRTLQKAVEHMVRRKRFDRETTIDLILLLTEEIGELARAVRAIVGLKSSRRTPHLRRAVEHELADCTIYLLAIGNRFQIDMEDAVRNKLGRDLARSWRARMVKALN